MGSFFDRIFPGGRLPKLSRAALANPYEQVVNHGGGVQGMQQTANKVLTEANGFRKTMHPMDQAALATIPIPVLGDVTGLAADARMYAQEPEQRNMFNYGLSALGLLPFVPAAATIKNIGKIDDLPMDHASRMKRAEDMGFDTDQVYYHGTGNLEEFDQFKPEFTGQGNDQYGSGFYLTNQPSTASGYATDRLSSDLPKLGGESSAGVMPLYTKDGNYLEIDSNQARNIGEAINLDSAQVRKMLDKSDAVKRSIDDEMMNPLGDHYDSFWDSGAEDWMLDDIAEKYAGQSPDTIEMELFDGDSKAFREAMKDVTGYDGVRVNFPESGEQHLVSWFPENIRSINANFDPTKKNSANLLASTLPAAIGLGLLNNYYPQEQYD